MGSATVNTVLKQVWNGFAALVAVVELVARLLEVEHAVRTAVFCSLQLAVTSRAIFVNVSLDLFFSLEGVETVVLVIDKQYRDDFAQYDVVFADPGK